MAIYTFVDGVRKRTFSNIPYVFVNGERKTIKSAWTFVNGTIKQLWNTWSFARTQLFTSGSSISLPAGQYQFIMRGGGGAGGQTGGNYGDSVGGVGGCGGCGKLVVQDVTVYSGGRHYNIVIGTGGLTYSNGGNGGFRGAGGVNASPYAGSGGGGGMPSYVWWTNNGNDYFYAANGGGGGGGGGGAATNNRRYDAGGAGGGGGGFYKIASNSQNGFSVTSMAGKAGKNSTGYYTAGSVGENGYYINSKDLNIYAGGGGNGTGAVGAGQARYRGASGSSGGGGPANSNTGAGGNGGGGAGGCEDAGGGANARNTKYSQYNSSLAPTNAGKTTPTNTLAENQSYGVNADYGKGGTTNTNGSQGFVIVKRIS